MITITPPTPAELRARWRQLAAELAHPAVEFTPAEFAPVLDTFRALRAVGHPFDATLAAVMDVLAAQRNGGDYDTSDSRLDCCEAREDRGTTGAVGG